MLIVFEGIEGSGKSTQVEKLKERLEAKGKQVVVCRDPGGTEISEQIREVLLKKSNKRMLDKTELLLFAAARIQVVAEIIKPALDQGKVVVCDRFKASTLVYQGVARGGDLEFIEKLNQFTTEGVEVDINVLLDLPVEAGLRRLNGQDRIEAEGVEFHEKVRAGYQKLARENSRRWLVVDASKSVDEVAEEVYDILRL